MTGFVTVDPKTLYLDQIVVAPEAWGRCRTAVLLDEAKAVAGRARSARQPGQFRAIRFYEKHGFAITRRRQEFRIRDCG